MSSFDPIDLDPFDPYDDGDPAAPDPLRRGLEPAAPAEPATERQLAAMAEGREPFSRERAEELVEQMRTEGYELRALGLARHVLAWHPDPPLALRVAELLVARGQIEAARDTLQPVLEGDEVPIRAWMLAGELAERAGDSAHALAHYERVLAVDFDYPAARERVQRLRDRYEPPRGAEGATLVADDALSEGRYRLERELGRGGAGTVFAARDDTLDRTVALKVYHRRARSDRERLRMEAQTPAKLEHAGVIRVLDVDERLAAIAMEHLPEGSVRDQLRRGPIPVIRAARWFGTLLEALAYVHGRGWVHRDLKPSNLLLREDDRIVITDFGVACAAGETPWTRSGAAEGTLAYMPPEQRRGLVSTPASDVHAFGATMREVLDALEDVPDPEWEEIAAACMRAQPEDRPTVHWLLERFGDPRR